MSRWGSHNDAAMWMVWELGEMDERGEVGRKEKDEGKMGGRRGRGRSRIGRREGTVAELGVARLPPFAVISGVFFSFLVLFSFFSWHRYLGWGACVGWWGAERAASGRREGGYRIVIYICIYIVLPHIYIYILIPGLLEFTTMLLPIVQQCSIYSTIT